MTSTETPGAARPSILGAPLTNALIFFAIVVAGAAYIIIAKLSDFRAVTVTFIPVAIMVFYALLIGIARPLRLRDDQSGDNLYYMGFLFTLTSLGVSLYQFDVNGAADIIVRNFGIAVASTIAGIALRIFFNQMRRDPIEVEATARAELAEAARRVRRELDNTVLEFGYFRRTTQQMLMDGLAETKLKADEFGTLLLSGLEDATRRSSEPLVAVSRQSETTLASVTKAVADILESGAKRLSGETDRLSASAAAATRTFDGISDKLAAMHTPDQIIEIKLTPMVQGLSRAVNAFSKAIDAQSAVLRDAVGTLKSITSETNDKIAAFHVALEEKDQTMQETLLAAQAAAAAAQEVASAAAASVREGEAVTSTESTADDMMRALDRAVAQSVAERFSPNR